MSFNTNAAPNPITVTDNSDPFLKSLYVLGNSDGDLAFDEAQGQTVVLPYPTHCDSDESAECAANPDAEFINGTKDFVIKNQDDFFKLGRFHFQMTTLVRRVS